MKNILKKLTFLSVTILFVFLTCSSVKASSLESIDVSNNAISVFQRLEEDSCASLLGDPESKEYPAYWIQWVLDIMKYAAVIALLVFVIMDFLKAITENDKEILKKVSVKAMKRFIYCVLIFFVPSFVKIVMTLFGAYGTCGIG